MNVRKEPISDVRESSFASPSVLPAPRARRRLTKPKWDFIFWTADARVTGWSKTLSRPWPWPGRGGCKEGAEIYYSVCMRHSRIKFVSFLLLWIKNTDLFQFGRIMFCELKVIPYSVHVFMAAWTLKAYLLQLQDAEGLTGSSVS